MPKAFLALNLLNSTAVYSPLPLPVDITHLSPTYPFSMRSVYCWLLLSLLCHGLTAQNVQVNIDLLPGRKPVSPFIYGRNNSLSDDPANPVSAANWQRYTDAGLNFYRENGGNNLTKYNWRLKLSSHPDWYNNVYAHDWDFAAASLKQHLPTAQGMWGFQLLGQAAQNNTHNFNDWAYNGSQGWTGTAQNLAGGGTVNTGGGSQALVNGDTSLYLEHWNADSTTGILNHWFGNGGLGLDSTRIRYWNMDNEVEIWSGTHDDAMPVQLDAESFMQRYFAVAKKARTLYPGIKLTGPVSPNEWQWYAWNNGPVTGSDGKQYPWLKYFIKRVAEEQNSTGIRLLDVIDLHFYPSSSNAADVVQMHRVFFDSSYAFPEANGVKEVNGGWDNSIQIEDIFGRCQHWLDQYMGPGNGVTFAVSETAVQLQNAPNALAVWYASMMGEFMNRGVEYFSPWGWDYGMWETLHLYSRYNKKNSIRAISSDELNVSAYATANDNNDSVTVALVNRSLTQTETVTLHLSHFLLASQAMTKLTLSGLPVGAETFVSQASNALQQSSVTPLNDSSLQITMAPMSVSSLLLVGSAASLPVSLVSFTAVKSDHAVRLNFSTSHEQNTAFFDIERSADGNVFAPVGAVAAQAAAVDNGVMEKDYLFYDTKPLSSINYYRLKMVDGDGSFRYSQVVAVAFDKGYGLAVFPNPAKQVLNVQLLAPRGQVLLELHDAAGRMVTTVRLQSDGGMLTTAIDISGLAPGLYYVHAGNQKMSFIKQ